MLYTATVKPQLLELLNAVMNESTFDSFVLVGGTSLAPVIHVNKLRLASDRDIAAMKLNAIAGRGSKKDFIDLYFILQRFTLNEVISFYNEKYPDGSIFMVLKSLSYFEDADLELSPKMYIDVQWDEIKAFISEQLKHI